MFYVSLIATAIGLTIGNFFYQWMGEGNYAEAFHRTWFQYVAIINVAI